MVRRLFPGPGLRDISAAVHRHTLAAIAAMVVAVSLVGTASAFALTSGGVPARATDRPAGPAGAAAAAMTTTTSPPTTTTTSTTTTTAPPPPPPTTVVRPLVAPAPPVVPTPTTTTCASALPALLADRYGAGQIITVEASGYGVTSATLTAWQWSGSCWTVVAGPWTARLGWNGLSTDKHEGDGTTPAGAYGFESTFYGNAANPGVQYPYRQLVCGDWWDEDSASPTYNTFQEVPCADSQPPFANGASEALWTETAAYPSFAVINYNPTDIPGLGSAIFLHADIGGPTAGCVSLPLPELDQVLDWMQPAQNPIIVMGTAGTMASY